MPLKSKFYHLKPEEKVCLSVCMPVESYKEKSKS